MADIEDGVLTPAQMLPGISHYRHLDVALVLREAWERNFQPPQEDIDAAFANAVALGKEWGQENPSPENSSMHAKRTIDRRRRKQISPYRDVAIAVSRDANEIPLIVSSVDDPRANLAIVSLSKPSRLLSSSPANMHHAISFTFRYHRHPETEEIRMGVSSSAQATPWFAEYEFHGGYEEGPAGYVVPNTTPEDFGLLQKALNVASSPPAARSPLLTRLY